MIAILSVSTAASASYVTIEPDDYPAGTDLSVVDPVATLAMVTGFGDTLRNPVLAVDASSICNGNCTISHAAATGTREFGYSAISPPGIIGGTNGWLYHSDADLDPFPGDAALAESSLVLRVDFLRPVDWVSILFREDQGFAESDPILMFGYDSTGQ